MSDNDYFSRENRLARRARRLAEFSDMGAGKTAKGKLTTQNAGQHAVQMARDLLNSFRMPSMPKLSYSGIRNARTAQSSSKLEDGVVTIFAEIRTISGVNVGFDIPMEIREGELQEPSVVVIDGAPRIIAQSTFDDLVERSTMYDLPPVRELYSAPVNQNQAAEAYGNRTKQKRVNTGLFSLGANRDALRAAIAGKDAQLSPLAPAKTPGSTYGVGGHQITQPIPKPKTTKYPGIGYSPNTDVTQIDDNRHEMTLPETTQLEDTQVQERTEPAFADPARDFHTFPADPRFTEETKEHKFGAVEDYDADDKWKKPDHDRNHQDDDWLDPAERYHQHDLHAGQEVSLKEALEVKERGGAVYDLPKGTKCKILRDHAGDNKSFVVRFEDESLEAIVERHFLAKSASLKREAIIRHENGKWVVKTHDGKKTLGTHDNKADAESQLRAIEMHKHEGDITAPPNSNAGGAILPPEEGMPVEQHEAAPRGQPTKMPKRKRSPDQKVKRQMNPHKHGDAEVEAGLSQDHNFIAKVNEEVGGMRNQGLSDVDIKHAVFTKYGPEVAEKVFA